MTSATPGRVFRPVPFFVHTHTQLPNNAINSDMQKRRFALLLHAGYGER